MSKEKQQEYREIIWLNHSLSIPFTLKKDPIFLMFLSSIETEEKYFNNGIERLKELDKNYGFTITDEDIKVRIIEIIKKHREAKDII